MGWISINDTFLTNDQQMNNAQLVANHFANTDWTKESISALIGNMHHESSINPDMHELGYGDSPDRGYGLVQWTPMTKYTDWATSQGLDYTSGDSQLARIDYEVDNNIQWIPRSDYGNMTFAQFRQNSGGWTVDYLTEVFMWSYERPATQAGTDSLPDRKDFANTCYTTLDWTGTGSGGTGYQLAKFPMDIINIAQGENGTYSHQGTWNIDFLGRTDQYPYYAPCDCECIAINADPSQCYAIWKSSNQVMCADGQVRYITWCNIHESPLVAQVGDKLTKGQLMGHTGIGGDATGDHWHFQVIEGSTYNGWDYVPDAEITGTRLHIYDVFAVNGVEITNGLGYPWKTSDYVDGSSVGTGNTTNKNNQLITLLMVGALNGWK